MTSYVIPTISYKISSKKYDIGQVPLSATEKAFVALLFIESENYTPNDFRF